MSELFGFGRRCPLRVPGRRFHVHNRGLVSCSLLPCKVSIPPHVQNRSWLLLFPPSFKPCFQPCIQPDSGPCCSLLPASRFTFHRVSKTDFGSFYSFLPTSRFCLHFRWTALPSFFMGRTKTNPHHNRQASRRRARRVHGSYEHPHLTLQKHRRTRQFQSEERPR